MTITRRALIAAVYTFLIFLLVMICLALFKGNVTYMDYKLWKAAALCVLAAIYGFYKGGISSK